jgi:sugar lactone lactonase YvrE
VDIGYYIPSVLVAPDGSIYFTSSFGTVFQRNGTIKLMTELSTGCFVNGLAFRPRSTELYAADGCANTTVSINITAETHKVVANLTHTPVGIAFNGSGEAFIVTEWAIYKWAPDSGSDPVLWSKEPGSTSQRAAAGVKATDVVFNHPHAIAVDAAVNMLISEASHPGKACLVWLVEAQMGKLRLVAGSGVCGGGWDPNPVKIQLDTPYGVAFGPEGRSAIIADTCVSL